MAESAWLPTAPHEAQQEPRKAAAEPRPPGPAPEAPLDLRIGKVIGERYRLLGHLGEGGMGAVYRAEHVLMKKVVALKLLHADLGNVDDAARRFEREAQSA